MAKNERLYAISPPKRLKGSGLLVLQDGTCTYLGDERPTRTAFALPGSICAADYEEAMAMGMRRCGVAVYRPLCPNCRKCIPVRIRASQFIPSRSQKRIISRCEGRFKMIVSKPTVDAERLALYQKYLAFQHDHVPGQDDDEEGYRRFLVDTLADTIEIAWRGEDNKLVALGIVDVTLDGLSTVYFFWDPDLSKLSIGTFSVLKELELCQKLNKKFYYFGYLVPGVPSMEYKATFLGAEVWDGQGWVALPSRDIQDENVQQVLKQAELGGLQADARNFNMDRKILIKMK